MSTIKINVPTIEEAVSINPDLDADLHSIAECIWHWGNLEATAYELMLTAKAALAQKEAEAFKLHKGRKDVDGKAPTEGAVKAAVALDPDCQLYTMKLIEAEGNLRRMKAAVTALMAKRDMLQSLSINRSRQMGAR